MKDGASQFQNFHVNFHKFNATCVPKMLTGAHKTQSMASALTLLQPYHKDGHEFLNHIVRVTGDETLVSFMNVETKEQSKQWIHTHSPRKPKNLNKRLSARKVMATFSGTRKSVDGGIHATRDHNNVRNVLRNTDKFV
jgi:hypothetical protein